MVFVFSAWWFVMLALVLVVVGLSIWLVLMNKQDAKLIEEFKQSATETKVEQNETSSNKATTSKKIS